MKLATALTVLFIALLIVVLNFGVPVGGGLTWDNTVATQRNMQRHSEEMARLANQDADSARWHESLRWLIAAAGVVGVVVIVGRTLRHRAEVQASVQIAALPILAQRPGAYLAQIDGDWYVADDARRELVPVSHRLNG